MSGYCVKFCDIVFASYSAPLFVICFFSWSSFYSVIIIIIIIMCTSLFFEKKKLFFQITMAPAKQRRPAAGSNRKKNRSQTSKETSGKTSSSKKNDSRSIQLSISPKTKGKIIDKEETANGSPSVLEKLIPQLSPSVLNNNKINKKSKKSKPIEKSYLADMVEAIIKSELKNYMMMASSSSTTGAK